MSALVKVGQSSINYRLLILCPERVLPLFQFQMKHKLGLFRIKMVKLCTCVVIAVEKSSPFDIIHEFDKKICFRF
jgi:hypothetical protein